jgi:ATP-dependent RNA helicase DeaD
VHRIGRTGRAGRKGDAISFVTPRERYLLAHIERATRQQPTQMQLPTTEDINSTRLTRFDDAITAALSDEARIAEYRDVIDHYVRNHDVPEQDVAAALAVVAQGDTPLLLDPSDDQLAKSLAADAERGTRKDRPAREGGAPRERRSRGDFTTYRIEVGRRHRVEPRQIVGALANEGGLGRDDFGAIQIKPDFSLVELPVTMDAAVLDKLRATRISGQLINITPDRGRPGHRGDDRPKRSYDDRPKRSYDDRPKRSFDGPRDDRPARKPRHKKD